MAQVAAANNLANPNLLFMNNMNMKKRRRKLFNKINNGDIEGRGDENGDDVYEDDYDDNDDDDEDIIAHDLELGEIPGINRDQIDLDTLKKLNEQRRLLIASKTAKASNHPHSTLQVNENETAESNGNERLLDSEKLAYLMYKQQQQQILAAQLGGAGVFRINNKTKSNKNPQSKMQFNGVNGNHQYPPQMVYPGNNMYDPRLFYKNLAGAQASGHPEYDYDEEIAAKMAGLIESNCCSDDVEHGEVLNSLGFNGEPQNINKKLLKMMMQKQQQQQYPINNAQVNYNFNNQPQNAFLQQKLSQKQNLSNIEYQKWLLNMEQQKLFKNGNGHAFIDEQLHYQQQQAAAVAAAAAEKAAKMSEVEKVKQELLGYQREIELMQKQREYAKLLKQQKAAAAAASASTTASTDQTNHSSSCSSYSSATTNHIPSSTIENDKETEKLPNRTLSPTPPYSSSNEIAPPPHARNIVNVIVNKQAVSPSSLGNQYHSETNDTANAIVTAENDNKNDDSVEVANLITKFRNMQTNETANDSRKSLDDPIKENEKVKINETSNTIQQQ